MTANSPTKYKALVLGELWEIDDIFQERSFQERFPSEVTCVRELDGFRYAIRDPEVDLILIEVEPHGLDVLEVVLETPPMRPVIMVGDQEDSQVILEAKTRGLDRYVIRVDDDQTNIDLLGQEIVSVFEQKSQPPKMRSPSVEDLFRFAQYHNVNQPFFIVDLHCRLLYVNESGVDLVEQLKGTRAHLGDTTEDFYIEESVESFNANLDRAFDGEDIDVLCTFESLPREDRYLRVFYQPVRYDGEILAVSIACKNIGARRIAEERFKQREKALWHFFDMVPLPLKVVGNDRTMERGNPAFAKMLGFDDPDKLQGCTAEEIVHPDDLDEISQGLERLFTNERSYFQAEHRYCRRDGQTVWVNQIGCAISDQNGRVERVLVIAVDVTRQKEAESRVEQSMRMEAIGEVAGGVAHDFNNILAVVSAIGHVLHAKLNLRGEEELLGYVERIQNAVEAGTSLTHQLLGFSRTQKIEQEAINLNQRIRETKTLFDGAIGDEIELQLSLEPELAAVEIGEGQLDQVVMNLVVNARDAMPTGGVLRIETRQLHIDSTMRENAPPDIEPGDWVVLAVSDQGVGMNRETLQRIFEPFYTTKGPGGGTGIGLATVYRIVERSSGTIYVDSEPEKGTTFTIFFPAAQKSQTSSPDRETAEADGSSAERRSSARVLLVEDEDDLREPYRIFVESLGCQVFEAATVEQAHNAVEEAGGEIDLLLADVILPDGSGVELAKVLREQIPNLTVIFMSGYAPDLLYGDKDFDGEWDFLPKPVSRKKLLSVVKSGLDSRPRLR